jgi:hypothetical protein
MRYIVCATCGSSRALPVSPAPASTREDVICSVVGAGTHVGTCAHCTSGFDATVGRKYVVESDTLDHHKLHTLAKLFDCTTGDTKHGRP